MQRVASSPFDAPHFPSANSMGQCKTHLDEGKENENVRNAHMNESSFKTPSGEKSHADRDCDTLTPTGSVALKLASQILDKQGFANDRLSEQNLFCLLRMHYELISHRNHYATM